MKTLTSLSAAFVATVILHSAAFAAQQPNRSAAMQAHGGSGPAAAATDDTPMAWRVARYPFRVGYSVVRTPLIVGETFTGKRTFISNRGFFQSNDAPITADERNTAPQGRGQRTLVR